MFEVAWIKDQDKMEYPFALAEAFAFKFGCGFVEEYTKEAKKSSLLDITVVGKQCCRMLIIKPDGDSIFPI
jgi:hypothetical protein